MKFRVACVVFSALAVGLALSETCRDTPLGTEYRGSKHTTMSGLTCQRWDSQTPHAHTRNDVSKFPLAANNEENYCRNPDKEYGTGPWCYTTDPDVRWESCGIPLCPACRETELGNGYLGTKSTTMSGLECQRWDSQTPHAHTRNDVSKFPLAANNEENYCRNPDNEHGTGPWCYTTDPDVRWESCGIPMCREEECRTSNMGKEYKGSRSTTLSGFTCQRWDSQSPHKHTRTGEENYCRNPDSERGTGPWCYTTNPDVRWETCGIPLCGSN